jgi:hypothetical protein
VLPDWMFVEKFVAGVTLGRPAHMVGQVVADGH